MGVSLFLASFAALSAGLAGGGILLILLFLVLLGASIGVLLKCKAMEKAAAE
ncbi:MAG: hypothetical protein JSU00_06825 [Acidobacteria bacterium]|nr:hypothetical protein [Acidobacteriota bacterium]